eukprot:5173016-Amphidinium_carterae.1
MTAAPEQNDAFCRGLRNVMETSGNGNKVSALEPGSEHAKEMTASRGVGVPKMSGNVGCK